MNRFAIALAMSVLAVGSDAYAEVFRCVTPAGQVSFASTPCPSHIGTADVQRSAQARLSSDWEERDFPHQLNENATKILKVSRRSKLIITNEKEISDRMQAIRPPPPGVPSRCVAPLYTAACFDPSGGRVRQPVKAGLFK